MFSNPRHQSLRKPTRFHILFSCTVILLFTAVVCLSTGPTPISPLDVLKIFLETDAGIASAHENIIIMLRGPRIAVAILVGAALAVSGAAFQGLFRNPLADPGIIGVSSGAATAAVAFIVLGERISIADVTLSQDLGLPLSAVTGALVTVVIINVLAMRNGNVHVGTLLLAGIAINALFGAITGLLVFISDDQQLRELTFWTLGATSRADWQNLFVCAPILLASIIALSRLGRAINALALGESAAHHLGYRVQRTKALIILFTGSAIGVSVALTGVLGFIGLVVPHLTRQLVGADNRIVLVLSACIGATLLLLADLFARNIVVPAELPVGIVCALIGAPFFLYLLLHRKKFAISL